MDKEKLDELIEYVGPFGTGSESDTFWDDYEDTFKEQIIRNKITKVKIYFQNEEEKEKEKEKETKEVEEEKKVLEEKYLIGIGLTFENAFTGEIKEIEHKGSDKVSGMKELIIKPGDYLKKFHINFKDDFSRISQIGFTTTKNEQLFVGIKDGLDKTIKQNDEDYIFIGTYGYAKERMHGFGCLFVKRNEYLKAHLFWFFMMRKLISKDKEFKAKWDVKYKELDKVYQFIWKALLLPDAAFAKIIKYCII